MESINILHLEANPDDANLVKTMLNRTSLPCDILWVETKKKFEFANTPEMNKLIYVSPAQEKIQRYFSIISKQDNTSTEYRILRPDGMIKNIFVKTFHVKNEHRICLGKYIL